MTNGIHVTVDGPVCWIEIENEGKRNALSSDHVEGLIDAFESRSEREDARAVVLRGAGEKAFCAGYDISRLSEDIAERGNQIERMADAIYECPCPTVAMVNGHAIGAGYLIATACDIRVAVEDARFGVPSARLGVVYTARGLQLSKEVIGTAYTKEVLFTGDQFDAERAREMGLVNRVYPREELLDRTAELAERIASNAPLSQRGTKKIIHALDERTSLTAAEEEWVASLRMEAYHSDDHEEGKRAFEENREPDFEGR